MKLFIYFSFAMIFCAICYAFELSYGQYVILILVALLVGWTFKVYVLDETFFGSKDETSKR